MPRRARVDAPGALQHIVVRGIARKRIFKDDADRDQFLERIGNLLIDGAAWCFAWALMPNHFHLLLKTGNVSISTLMRRLLTGYAIYFNHRHRRAGHLFQNRYKSIQGKGKKLNMFLGIEGTWHEHGGVVETLKNISTNSESIGEAR